MELRMPEGAWVSIGRTPLLMLEVLHTLTFPQFWRKNFSMLIPTR